jgi:aerobic-type carbon monoxide dehydrogenase small subunit (CoxS/CutS family)
VELTFTVNGRTATVDVAPGASLLHVLRETLQLTGTKEGCVEGECGACTVLVAGRPVDSCLYAAHAAQGKDVTTIEGIATDGEMTELQQAMVESGGVQCGFCTPGFVVTLTALLAENPTPTEAEVRTALAGNICRCTGYSQIIDAVMQSVRP